MNHLETQQLSCGYPNRRVLEDLSLNVQSGEVLALLGPNGSGKTTLLRTLARLLHPQKGAVLLHEKDIRNFRTDELARQVALTPQTERRDWPLSVEESVSLGRAAHRGWLLPFTKEDRERVDQALRSTGLTELRNRPVTELSGGEWRRTVLARALAQGAGVLLLDEPTAGLDLKYQVDILHLVRNLAASEGLIVVLTLHDLNHASLYADRIAVLSEHNLLAVGSPEEVLTAELISQTFGVPVTVTPHPVYGTPLVVPLVHF